MAEHQQQQHQQLLPHIILFPSPGMGHLIPIIQFSTRLLHLFPSSFSLTLALIPFDTSSAQKSALSSLPDSVSTVILPFVDLSDLSPDTRIEPLISLSVSRSLLSLRGLFRSLTLQNRPIAALVVDLFGTDAFDVAAEFGVPSYIFFPSNALCLSLIFNLPELDETVNCEYWELDEPVRLPGCVPVQGRDLLDPVQDRKNDAYRWILHHARRFWSAEGIIVNSFFDLESGALKGLREIEPGNARPPVYGVGPLVRDGTGELGKGALCLTWLEGQPRGSVLFVSFGSGGTLSWDQINELAWGLEMSEQRFLWVVRSPNDRSSNGTYFSAEHEMDPIGFLPDGFMERTRGQGLVLSSWAPQVSVLAHGSTGGFLTHCGWNSTLESVVHGVPLIAWPLYAEQRTNAVFLADELKVALRLKVEEGGVVGRKEIARVVRALMEGKEGKDLRGRMRNLKYAAARALSDDGSSTTALSEVVRKWTSNHTV